MSKALDKLDKYLKIEKELLAFQEAHPGTHFPSECKMVQQLVELWYELNYDDRDRLKQIHARRLADKKAKINKGKP